MADETIQAWLEARRIDPAMLVADEVVGVGHAMAELRSVAGRLRHPERVLAAGGELPRGILLTSPAGTGKTTLARWLARTVGADVPTYEVPADELTATRVRAIFAGLAGVRSVVIIDEIDLVGLDRSFLGSNEQRVLRALLAALDGLGSRPGPLVVAATTRRTWELDDALTRAGRLGIHVTLTSPTESEREALLRTFAQGRAVAPDIDWPVIAARSPGFSPAALRQALNDALGLALADDRFAIAQADLLTAIGRDGEIAPAVEPPPAWWDRRREIVHELGHLCVGAVLLGPGAVRAIRVSHHSSATVIGLAGRPPHVIPDAELRTHLAVGYGGLAAERVLFSGGATMGAADDIARITDLLEARLAAGMDPSVPPIALAELGTRASEALRTAFGAALARAAETALALATTIVTTNTVAIEALVGAFDDTDTLEGPALQAAIVGAGFRDTAGHPVTFDPRFDTPVEVDADAA